MAAETSAALTNVQIVGTVIAILVGLTALYTFFKRKRKYLAWWAQEEISPNSFLLDRKLLNDQGMALNRLRLITVTVANVSNTDIPGSDMPDKLELRIPSSEIISVELATNHMVSRNAISHSVQDDKIILTVPHFNVRNSLTIRVLCNRGYEFPVLTGDVVGRTGNHGLRQIARPQPYYEASLFESAMRFILSVLTIAYYLFTYRDLDKFPLQVLALAILGVAVFSGTIGLIRLPRFFLRYRYADRHK